LNASSSSKHTFHYHASAHVLSGQFWRPFQRVIEVQAPSVLPSIGGIGNSRVENYRLDELVSFTTGYTHVSGSEMEKKDDKGQSRTVHNTQVTATIEGLNILDVITADRIVARLASVYDAEDREAAGEPRILLIGSRFENLRIAGCDVHVSFHHKLFLDAPTFGLATANNDLQKLAAETGEAAFPDTKSEKIDAKPGGALLCSLVKDVKFKCPDEGVKFKSLQDGEHVCPGVTQYGRHTFHVREFGNVYLGEVLFEHGRKMLTMLRLKLGSPNGAGMIVVQASSNGQPYPPHK
jgi:hypothetical protein